MNEKTSKTGINHQKLTAPERDLIALWLGQGESIREIARRLKRSPSTISEEIKRNSFRGKYYVAIHAQAKAVERKGEAGKRYPLKDPLVYAYVLDKLRSGWSPEQIAGRLKKIYGRTMICHETIYRFIYAKENKEKRLWEYLPWKRKKRKKKSGRKTHRLKIPDRVSIHQRPEHVNQRLAFGHWEGDSLMGKGRIQAIHTEVERLSRYLMAKKVSRLDSDQTIKAQKKLFEKLPTKARQSTTLDNGKEFVKHTTLKRELRMQTYFADPYSAWQRGTIEHHNGLLRRYLPKGTDFNSLTQEELDDIVEEINNRPRKVLNYYTPKEVFQSYLGVRIQL